MSFSVIFEASVYQVNRSLPKDFYLFALVYGTMERRCRRPGSGSLQQAPGGAAHGHTPGSVLTVAEFLRHVRGMVVAFVVNRLSPFPARPRSTASTA